MMATGDITYQYFSIDQYGFNKVSTANYALMLAIYFQRKSISVVRYIEC